MHASTRAPTTSAPIISAPPPVLRPVLLQRHQPPLVPTTTPTEPPPYAMIGGAIGVVALLTAGLYLFYSDYIFDLLRNN